MKWKLSDNHKEIYEALTAVASERIEVKGNSAKVYSSSGGKAYDVRYDPDTRTIGANDNVSYWTGRLGYPAIAYLLKTGIVQYDPAKAVQLKNVHWKDVNTRHKNDYDAAIKAVRQTVADRGGDLNKLDQQLTSIERQIKDLSPNKPAKRQRPPAGY